MTRNSRPEGRPNQDDNHCTVAISPGTPPDQLAAHVLEILSPAVARRFAAEVIVLADRLEHRHSPYIGPSADHRAGPGYVHFATLAERERLGVRR